MNFKVWNLERSGYKIPYKLLELPNTKGLKINEAFPTLAGMENIQNTHQSESNGFFLNLYDITATFSTEYHFHDWFHSHHFQVCYDLEDLDGVSKQWAAGSISDLSGDPATGKSYRCVQNKPHAGIEHLFHVERGMEGSYHPQGRLWPFDSWPHSERRECRSRGGDKSEHGRHQS